MTYKSRAKWKMLWGIYSAIYVQVNVSVEKCVEIKGERLCWKIAKLFYFCHLKKLFRPETFGPYCVYLTTLNILKRQTSVSLERFEPAIPSSGRPQAARPPESLCCSITCYKLNTRAVYIWWFCSYIYKQESLLKLQVLWYACCYGR